MTEEQSQCAIARKERELANQGGIAGVCLKMFNEAGPRGLTFPEIADVLFVGEYNAADREQLGFVMEVLFAGEGADV
jgi:hypothetical protein